jgi:hypothetical protein
MKRWRKTTWAIIAWSTLMVVWMIGGGISASHKAAEQCAHPYPLTTQECLDASHAGAGIGIGLLIVLWFIGFVVLGFVWFMTKPREVIIVTEARETR